MHEKDAELGTPISTKNFGYAQSGWTDLLTSVDGNALTYDSLGNLLTYNGYTYTWEVGRRLTQITNGTNTYSYKYDDNGIRTQKTINGVTTHYTTVDGRITGQYDGANTIYFRYDATNSLIGFNLNGTEYTYLKNIQGDIEGILDLNGSLVVSYTYDAWGKVLSVTDTSNINLGMLNPMRYRGYYYDNETGYYYLQSRYYNPEFCRFINADEPSTISKIDIGIGLNLLVYCYNNPLIYADRSGYVIETVLDIGSIIWSLIDLISNPSFLNICYLVWDIASAIIPFVPGSYAAKGGKFVLKIASKVDDFKWGSKFLTGSYNELRKVVKGFKNVEVHHLVEKRFSILFKGIKVDDYLSIPLDKNFHKIITKRWRDIFPYGMKYKKITKSQMKNAIKKVYKDMPQLLNETLKWFEKNWRK